MYGFTSSKNFRNFQNREKNQYVPSDITTIFTTTTESENKTNIISSVWQKISNFFGGETTTEVEPEMRKEVLTPEDKIGAEERKQIQEIAPMSLNRQSDSGTWQKENYGQGNMNSFHQHNRKKRSSFPRSFKESAALATEVRKIKSFTKHYNAFKYITETPTIPAFNKVPIVIEEFDQGETEGGRIKRFKINMNSTDWKKEKIVVGSDPVEDIDNTNYIQETKNSNFPFRVYSFEPIIVEDSLSVEITTFSEKELPPLKLIDY